LLLFDEVSIYFNIKLGSLAVAVVYLCRSELYDIFPPLFREHLHGVYFDGEVMITFVFRIFDSLLLFLFGLSL
jgi:hypothetical protein